MSEFYISPKEYRRVTGIGFNALYTRLKDGTIPAMRTSKRGHWKINSKVLVDWEKQVYGDWANEHVQ